MINSSVQKRAPLPLVSVIMPVYNTKEEYLRELKVFWLKHIKSLN